MKIDRNLIDDSLKKILACGPRAAGSQGEAGAVDVIERMLSDAGLEVSRERFVISHWPGVIAGQVLPVVALVILTVVGWTFFRRPWMACLGLVGLLGGLVIVRHWHRLAVRLFDVGRQIDGFNVVGRSTARVAGGRTFVFFAHYDSKSQLLPVGVRVGGMWLSAVVCAVLLVVLLLGPVGNLVDVGVGVVYGLMAVAYVGLLLVVLNVSGNRSPGALDNASGVSVLIALANVLPGMIGGDVNLIFVATGAEENGMGGALRFIQSRCHEFDGDDTLCFNFDTLGVGGSVYFAGSREPFNDVLARLSHELAARGIASGRLPVLVGVGMDHMQITAANVWATSLTQGSIRAGLYIHSSRDTVDKVDTGQLTAVAEAVCDTLGALTVEGVGVGRAES